MAPIEAVMDLAVEEGYLSGCHVGELLPLFWTP